MKSHESGYAKIRWAFQDVGGFSGIAEEDGTAIAGTQKFEFHFCLILNFEILNFWISIF